MAAYYGVQRTYLCASSCWFEVELQAHVEFVDKKRTGTTYHGKATERGNLGFHCTSVCPFYWRSLQIKSTRLFAKGADVNSDVIQSTMWLWRRHRYHPTDERVLKSVIIKHMHEWPFLLYFRPGMRLLCTCVGVYLWCSTDGHIHTKPPEMLWYHLEPSSTPTCQLTASTTMTTPTTHAPWKFHTNMNSVSGTLNPAPQTKPY